MTIYEIKKQTKNSAPYFFSKETLKFFGQTLKSFKVSKLNEVEYLITAPSYWNGKLMGNTQRIFNKDTKKLNPVSFLEIA